MASLLPPKNRPLDWRYSVMRISDRIFGAVVILWSFMYVMAARGIAKPFFFADPLWPLGSRQVWSSSRVLYQGCSAGWTKSTRHTSRRNKSR
jgi:hypothetical protein